MSDKRAITKDNPYKICFVCLGNICRSPTAEGVFQHLVNERGLQPYFEIDSAGTSAYHVGETANSRSQQIASQHGVTLQSRARRFESFDLDYFDLIVAMDQSNLEDIHQLDSSGKHEGKIRKLREFDPQPEDGNVPDPYHGGIHGFENVFQIVERSCRQLLDKLEDRIEEPQ